MRAALFTVALLASVCTVVSAQIKPLVPPDKAFETAERLANEGRFRDALAVLQDVERAEPNRPGLDRLMGVLHYRQGDFGSAVKYLKSVVERDPADKEATQLLGLSYYRTGRPEAAIPLLERVKAWFPSANVDATYVLGLAYLNTRDFDKARAAFAGMFGVPADSAASHLFLARMLLRHEFESVAEENARRALALNPKLPLAHYLLGEIYLYKSMIPEAIKELASEAQLNPAHAATYYKLGDAYTRAGDFEKAQRALQHSIWLDASASGPFTLLGKVLLRKNDTELAAATLQRAVSMDPNNVMAHHLLGQAYQALGKTAEAERELKLAQELQSAQNPKPSQ